MQTSKRDIIVSFYKGDDSLASFRVNYFEVLPQMRSLRSDSLLIRWIPWQRRSVVKPSGDAWWQRGPGSRLKKRGFRLFYSFFLGDRSYKLACHFHTFCRNFTACDLKVRVSTESKWLIVSQSGGVQQLGSQTDVSMA